MAKEENYYQILGIPENATADDIRNAYQFKLKYDGSDNNKLKIIYKAYETLIDKEKRKSYDLDLFNNLLYSGDEIDDNKIKYFIYCLSEYTIKQLLLKKADYLSIETQKMLYSKISDILDKIPIYATLGYDFIVRVSSEEEAKLLKQKLVEKVETIIYTYIPLKPFEESYYSGYGDRDGDVSLNKIKEILSELDRLVSTNIGTLFLTNLILKCNYMTPAEFSTKLGYFLIDLGNIKKPIVIDTHPIEKAFQTIEDIGKTKTNKYGTGYGLGFSGWYISNTAQIKDAVNHILKKRLQEEYVEYDDYEEYDDYDFEDFEDFEEYWKYKNMKHKKNKKKYPLDYVQLDLPKIKKDLQALSLKDRIKIINEVFKNKPYPHYTSELSYVVYLAKEKDIYFDELNPAKWNCKEIAKPNKKKYMNKYSWVVDYLIAIINYGKLEKKDYFNLIEKFIMKIPIEHIMLASKLKELLKNFDYKKGRLVNQLYNLKFNQTFFDSDEWYNKISNKDWYLSELELENNDDMLLVFFTDPSYKLFIINKKTGEINELSIPIHNQNTLLSKRYFPNDKNSYRFYVNGMAISKEDYERMNSYDIHTEDLFSESEEEYKLLTSDYSFKSHGMK